MYYSFDPIRHGGACAFSSWSRGLSRHLWNYALSSMVRGHRTHTRGARILYLAPTSVRRFALSSKSGGGGCVRAVNPGSGRSAPGPVELSIYMSLSSWRSGGVSEQTHCSNITRNVRVRLRRSAGPGARGVGARRRIRIHGTRLTRTLRVRGELVSCEERSRTNSRTRTPPLPSSEAWRAWL